MRRAAAFLVLAVSASVAAGAQTVPCEDGQAVLPGVGAFACDRVDLVGHLGPAAFGVEGSTAADAHNDLWGWTDPRTGTEYALVGTLNGVGFVDLSVPSAPRLVGKLSTATTASTWRDVKVYRNHAFVVSEAAGHGMQVFDLTRLRGVTGPDPVLFDADARYTGIGNAHNLVINEATGFAYAVGARRTSTAVPEACAARGFHVIDIRQPTRPTFVTCFSDQAFEADPYITAGYTHDAQCVVYDGPDTDYTGRELCFGANEDVVTVFDVTDKAAVRVVSQGEYPNDVYTHQGWLTEDQAYFLINDEIDERTGAAPFQRTIVMDVRDLDDPEVAFIYDSGLSTVDHNLYVRGAYAYQANYESGLRVVSLKEIEGGSLSEVAFFDTYPGRTTTEYNGAWSVYPYFRNGLVVVNDIDSGLFVLRVRIPLVDPQAGYELSEPAPNPSARRARLTLSVARAQAVRAELFDMAGRRLATVFEGAVAEDTPVLLEVARGGLASGAYVVRVSGERFEASRQIVFAR